MSSVSFRSASSSCASADMPLDAAWPCFSMNRRSFSAACAASHAGPGEEVAPPSGPWDRGVEGGDPLMPPD
eukprot:9268597-Alexandrium_andersonii.AAC.1